MDKDFTRKGIELIKKADAAYLTTIDLQGFPSTRAMFNLRNGKQFPRLIDFMSQYDTGFSLFFTTNTSSAKVKQIIINPEVSVYICDTKIYHGIMCQGKIEIITDKTIKNALWHDEWKMYYPDGKDSEDYAILRLEPSLVRQYYNLEQYDLKL